MADTADDLSAPLGQQTARRKRRFRLPFTGMQALAVVLGLILVAFAGFAIFGDNPLGGEPVAHVALGQKAPEEKAAAPAAAPAHAAKTEPKEAAPGEHRTVTIIDGSSGKRERRGDRWRRGFRVRQAGRRQGRRRCRRGPGNDHGRRRSAAFGKDPLWHDPDRGGKSQTLYRLCCTVRPGQGGKMPVVAIVVGGLGVGAAKTSDAIMRLPGAVTLAFTPYGSDPGKLAEKARAQRHEIFLEIPMEPYDYPDNDPGPQTLLATLGAEQNLDRLFWHLGRLQAYAGIANFMGARFVATDVAMAPVIREAAKRGLGYFDDGSAPRSVAGSLAASQAMPFAKGDVAIDAVPTAAEIDHALAKLEATAKERGIAIGTASALPVSIERISAWTRGLESRGVLLVPLTTAILKSKSS